MLNETRQRWALIESLFLDAVELPISEQGNFLEEKCGDDIDIQTEVRKLLLADRRADFLEERIPAAFQAFLNLPDLRIGERVGPFRIETLIGTGGMAAVYRGFRVDGAFEQTVAIKLVRKDLSAAFKGRFIGERAILARLEHPAIARLLDGGLTSDGSPWLAMEYIDGQPITEFCDANRLTIDQRLEVFCQVCEAVEYAHGQLIVHRDLKPSNILVKKNGRAVLLDFGIAKMLAGPEMDAEEKPVGSRAKLPRTPAYAAPEQVRGEGPSVATDIYSLGVLLCELLVARWPIGNASMACAELERAVSEDEPLLPSNALSRTCAGFPPPHEVGNHRQVSTSVLRRMLSGDLDAIVSRALSKRPDARYKSVGALSDDIVRYLDGFAVRARPNRPTYRARKFVRRHRAPILATMLIFVSLIAGLGVALDRTSLAQAEAERARNEAAKTKLVTDYLVSLFEASDPSLAPGAYIQSFTRDDPGARTVLARGLEQAASLGDEPAVQAKLLSVIAETMIGLGDFRAAVVPAMQAARIRHALVSHPPLPAARRELATSLATLARAQHQLGQHEYALINAESGLGLIGTSNPEEAAVRGRLLLLNGNVLATMARNEEALNRYEAALVLFQETGLHDQAAQTIKLLGALHRHEGSFSEGARVLTEGIGFYSAVRHRNPVRLLELKGYLGIVRLEQNRLAEAEGLLRTVVHSLRTLLPENHLLVQRYEIHLGAVRGLQGDFAEAIELLTPAFEHRRDEVGPDHISTAEAGAWLGGALAAVGRFEEGEALLISALNTFTNVRGADDRYVVQIQEGLDELYSAWGRPTRS
jgi:eukaryotic-like serine/threonine-protein kinase